MFASFDYARRIVGYKSHAVLGTCTACSCRLKDSEIGRSPLCR